MDVKFWEKTERNVQVTEYIVLSLSTSILPTKFTRFFGFLLSFFLLWKLLNSKGLFIKRSLKCVNIKSNHFIRLAAHTAVRKTLSVS